MTQQQQWRLWWLINAINVVIAAMLWLRVGLQQLSLRDKLAALGIIVLIYAVYLRLPFIIGSGALVQWPVSMKLKVTTANAMTFMIYGLTACLFPVDFQASHASIIGVLCGLLGMLLLYLPPVWPTFSIGFHIRQSSQATKAMLLFMGRSLIVAGILIMVIGNAVPNVLTPVAFGLITFAFIGGSVYGQHVDRRKH